MTYFIDGPNFLFYCCEQTLSKHRVGKDSFGLHIPIRAILEGSQGRNSSRDCGERFFPSLFPKVWSASFSYTKDYLSSGGSTHRGLGPLTSILNQEDATGLPTGQSVLSSSSAALLPRQLQLSSS